MKLKSLVFLGCLSLFSSVFAGNVLFHAQATNEDKKAAQEEGLKKPGYCEIEVINNSYDDVRVYGTFDDGVSLVPFNLYAYDYPRSATVSLFYYGYCHSGMYLYIDTFSGYNVYSGYTPTYYTVRVIPFMDKVKAEVHAK